MDEIKKKASGKATESKACIKYITIFISDLAGTQQSLFSDAIGDYSLLCFKLCNNSLKDRKNEESCLS